MRIPTTDRPAFSGVGQRPHCSAVKGLHKGLDRSKYCFKSHKLCSASSSKSSDACIDFPEPTSRVTSTREARDRLEQLYQLEQPQPSAWYPPALLQELARRGLLLEAGFLPVQVQKPPAESSKLKDEESKQKQQEYYANLGDAIRTLREETPFLFQRDLTCEHPGAALNVLLMSATSSVHSKGTGWEGIAVTVRAAADDIYRDDIVFRDSRNTFHGKKNYKTTFWSLRFHGRLFFSRLTVNVSRIWQPEESKIK